MWKGLPYACPGMQRGWALPVELKLHSRTTRKKNEGKHSISIMNAALNKIALRVATVVKSHNNHPERNNLSQLFREESKH